MQMINLVFDEECKDVDLLMVPKEIACNVDAVVTEFFTWLSDSENQKQFLVSDDNGGSVLSVGTDAFLWWLNNIRILDSNKAYIVRQYAEFSPHLPTAFF